MLEIVGDDSSAMSAAVSELLLMIDGAAEKLVTASALLAALSCASDGEEVGVCLSGPQAAWRGCVLKLSSAAGRAVAARSMLDAFLAATGGTA